MVAVRRVGEVESVTVMTTVATAGAVGDPEMAPVEASNFSPAGRPVADQVYGLVPPFAANVAEYAEPTMPPDSEVVVMDSGGVIVSERLAVAFKGVGVEESVRVIATVLVPAAEGLPLMTPVDALMFNPAGRPVAAQVYGVLPPVPVSVTL